MEINETTLLIQGKEISIHSEHPIRVTCMEHVERELDDYVNKYEVAPDTFKVTDVDDPHLDKRCMVCGADGAIVLLHVKGM